LTEQSTLTEQYSLPDNSGVKCRPT